MFGKGFAMAAAGFSRRFIKRKLKVATAKISLGFFILYHISLNDHAEVFLLVYRVVNHGSISISVIIRRRSE